MSLVDVLTRTTPGKRALEIEGRPTRTTSKVGVVRTKLGKDILGLGDARKEMICLV